jgi:acetyl-CoA carboxylase carboxyl transferase subunit beta
MSESWINKVRPKISLPGWLSRTKPDVPDSAWATCPETGQMVHRKQLEENLFVFPGSNFHMRMSATQRLESFFDGRSFEKVAVPGVALDPLKFRDERRYTERLKQAKEDTGLDDAVLVGEGKLDGRPLVAAVQDFSFMGGSLGMAAGEAVLRGMLRAVDRRTPFVMFAASGGARMQEGILSLMQMPRTTIAVQKLREVRLPYIVVLTNPTTGGVTASYAMLGDIQIAEPGALIGFAGPRVIEQTIRQQLPEGFQRSEYLLAHGMVDMVVHRHQLRGTIARLCRILGSGLPARHGRRAEDRAGRNGIQTHDGKYMNGAHSEAKLLEARAESGKAKLIEAEPVEDGERFRPGARSKEAEPRTGPPAPKTGPSRVT